MNLLLLSPGEISPDGHAKLTGRRVRHAREVLRLAQGDTLRVGVLGGNTGSAEVLSQEKDALVLRVTLDTPPPPRPGIDVLLAIPRPKALKKVLPALASLGVDNIVLINAARVEKSYFDSNVLEPQTRDELLHLGLEQAKDTVPPKLTLAPLFRPFVEDRLDTHFGPGGLRLLAHPSLEPNPPTERKPGERLLVAIGPEGGWVPFEVELLRARGFSPLSLGARTLRVEVAVPYLLGRLSNEASLRA